MSKITAEDINTVVNTVSTVLPAAIAAYRAMYSVFKRSHPDATFEDFNAALLSDSQEVQAASTEWLVSHGYVQDSDGTWSPRK
jgi:hypothetical protein